MKTLLDAQFEKFDKENPKVYTELVRLTEQAYRRGRRKIGIGMLFEIIRWDMMMSTTDPEFKMNNNYRSRYARKIMDNDPRFVEMFEVRELKS